ncbi:hypothetical protein CK203_014438 [Vitis vinifera]|uniref:Uncharacterized protein n=1 Tax=Vitis vinifera TaxID=29760 RepID=A0A438K527_VITVI|nr:hypothetical protein CK203_014438 [Vitis vinifera]
MDDKKTAAKLAISTRQVDLSLGAFPFPCTQSVYEFHSPVNPSSQEFLVQKRSGCSHNFREFHPEFTFRNMKSQLQEHVIGIPVSCQYDKPSLSNGSGAIIQMRLGPKFSETVKGKLSLGARILQVGGVKRVFKANFWCWRRREAIEGFPMLLINNRRPYSWSPLYLFSEDCLLQ